MAYDYFKNYLIRLDNYKIGPLLKDIRYNPILIRVAININIKIRELVKALIIITNIAILKKIIIIFTRPSYILVIR